MPAAIDARLDHIGRNIISPFVELGQISFRDHTAPMGGKPSTEDVGDKMSLTSSQIGHMT